MMFQMKKMPFNYIPELELQILELPYVDDELSMFILLPQESQDGTDPLLKVWNKDTSTTKGNAYLQIKVWKCTLKVSQYTNFRSEACSTVQNKGVRVSQLSKDETHWYHLFRNHISCIIPICVLSRIHYLHFLFLFLTPRFKLETDINTWLYLRKRPKCGIK